MHLEKATRRAKSIARTATKALLIVGPQPPPIGGEAVTVQAIAVELARHTSIGVTLINTSSPSDYGRKVMRRLSTEKLRRVACSAFRVGQYRASARPMFANVSQDEDSTERWSLKYD